MLLCSSEWREKVRKSYLNPDNYPLTSFEKSQTSSYIPELIRPISPAPRRPHLLAASWIIQLSFQRLFSDSNQEATNTNINAKADKRLSHVTLTTSNTAACWDFSQLWLGYVCQTSLLSLYVIRWLAVKKTQKRPSPSPSEDLFNLLERLWGSRWMELHIYICKRDINHCSRAFLG